MIAALALALLALVPDPTGDAVGDGSLVPPTAAVYHGSSGFDLESLEWLAGDRLGFVVTFAGPPRENPDGYFPAILELYLDSVEGGSRPLLPGSDMSLPEGRGWDLAIRLTGDGADAYLADADGNVRPGPAVTVSWSERTVALDTPFPPPREAALFGIVGLYDPFAVNPWRPISPDRDPWSFSSREQARPVVDLAPGTGEQQHLALQTGVLPDQTAPPRDRLWLGLMVAGLVLTLAGAGARLAWRVRPAPLAGAGAPDDQVEEAAAPPAREGDPPAEDLPEPDLGADVVVAEAMASLLLEPLGTEEDSPEALRRPGSPEASGAAGEGGPSHASLPAPEEECSAGGVPEEAIVGTDTGPEAPDGRPLPGRPVAGSEPLPETTTASGEEAATETPSPGEPPEPGDSEQKPDDPRNPDLPR